MKSSEGEQSKSAPSWLSKIATTLSVLAIAVSVYSFYLGEQRRARDIPFDVVPKAYEKYYEMNKIQLDKWHLAHMFAVKERYESLKQLVVSGIGSPGQQKWAEYISQERAVADFIFTYYEQSLYQWAATQDTERRFIAEILEFLRSSLLTNPRLVYWWRQEGGGLEASYQSITRQDWKEHVYSRIANDKAACDPLGPFGASKIPIKQFTASC